MNLEKQHLITKILLASKIHTSKPKMGQEKEEWHLCQTIANLAKIA